MIESEWECSIYYLETHFIMLFQFPPLWVSYNALSYQLQVNMGIKYS